MNISFNCDGNDSSDGNDRQRSGLGNSQGSSGTDPALSPASSLTQPQYGAEETNDREDERIRELRESLGASADYPTSVLRAILEANERESMVSRPSSRQSHHSSGHSNSYSHDAAPQSQQETINTPGRRRRTWDPCQSAPSRPGIIRMDINSNPGNYDIGHVDEPLIYSRRVDAVHTVHANLERRIGRNLRERGEYDDMLRREVEGEARLATLGEEGELRPSIMVWDVPDDLGERMLRREPMMPPPPDEPLPLPESLMRVPDASNELVVGVFVDPGPGSVDDEDEKREEGSLFSSNARWANMPMDRSQTPMGPNDHVVRCYRCRAGLRADMNAGLVICPRCRTISPAADVADVE